MTLKTEKKPVVKLQRHLLPGLLCGFHAAFRMGGSLAVASQGGVQFQPGILKLLGSFPLQSIPLYCSPLPLLGYLASPFPAQIMRFLSLCIDGIIAIGMMMSLMLGDSLECL